MRRRLGIYPICSTNLTLFRSELGQVVNILVCSTTTWKTISRYAYKMPQHCSINFADIVTLF